MRGQIGHVGESAAKFDDRLTNIGAIFADQGINVIDGLVGFLGGLAKILQQRLKLFADGADVLESGVKSGAVFLDHAAGVGQGCREIGAILNVQEIVHAVDGDFQLGGAIVEGDEKLLGMGSEIVDLHGERVEINVIFGRQLSTIRSDRGLGGAGKDFKMIVAEGTHAHDLDVTVGLDRQLGLHGEGDFDARGILGIDAEALNTSDLGTAGITN